MSAACGSHRRPKTERRAGLPFHGSALTGANLFFARPERQLETRGSAR